MSTYTTNTNTKPESKFEDVPEEVLTDPTMRTALGMDPIPGMNTPVDDNKQISLFDYMQNKNNSSTSSTTTTAAPEVTVFKNLVHPEFGELRTVEFDGEPWFVGKDVAEALGYNNTSKAIITHVADEDKIIKMLPNSQNGKTVGKTYIINESGLYSLILSSKLEKAVDAAAGHLLMRPTGSRPLGATVVNEDGTAITPQYVPGGNGLQDRSVIVRVNDCRNVYCAVV